MKVLFATVQPFPPQMYGGLQICVSTLIRLLGERGKKGVLLCALMGGGWTELRGRILMKLMRRKAVPDRDLSHLSLRAWFPWESMEEVIAREKPDVIVIPSRQPVKMALAAQKTGTPVVMWLQDVEFKDHGGDFKALGNIPCVANSAFTADKFRKAFGVSPIVIHPIMQKHNYRTDTTRENVTLINPNTVKGVEIALQIAEQCPGIPFAFVESWPLKDTEREYLARRMEVLKNITLHPPVDDMKTVYGKAKILLAPSQWEEAYGRVASEAQFSGIPVVASNHGGLPEAVGDGGILLEPSGPVEPWVNAVRRLWNDQEYYKAMSEKAYRHAERDSLNPEYQIVLWEQVLASALQSQK